jgi:hypothetical protein
MINNLYIIIKYIIIYFKIFREYILEKFFNIVDY